jgi:hypothetical protein
VAPVLMKTRSPSTREPFLAAPSSTGIVLQRRYKRPHVMDPSVSSTGHRPSTVTMADRAPARRNTAVAHRLEGTSRILITDDISVGVRTDRDRRRTGVAATGVETIIELVKSDAPALYGVDGCEMSPLARDENARYRSRMVANTNVAGFEVTFFVIWMVNPSDVDTAFANIAKYMLNTENAKVLRRSGLR